MSPLGSDPPPPPVPAVLLLPVPDAVGVEDDDVTLVTSELNSLLAYSTKTESVTCNLSDNWR